MSSTYVRPVLFWPLLTGSFQTELALNTHGMVSDIHQNMSRGHEDTGGKYQAVSNARTPPNTETISDNCLGPDQVGDPRYREVLTLHSYLEDTESLPPYRPESSLDVTS